MPGKSSDPSLTVTLYNIKGTDIFRSRREEGRVEGGNLPS